MITILSYLLALSIPAEKNDSTSTALVSNGIGEQTLYTDAWRHGELLGCIIDYAIRYRV